MADELTTLLDMMYPKREAPPEALRALFGFGPQQAFDVLKNLQMFPTYKSSAEEELKKSKLANQMTEIGIPQRRAEVESFLHAPQSLQFFGKEHFTPEGVALYQDPTAALRRYEAGTGLTEAQIKNTLANAGYTEAQTGELMTKMAEIRKFGGPLAAETFFKSLASAGTRALPTFSEDGGVDIGRAVRLPKAPEETLKEAVIPKVVQALGGGDIKKAMSMMQLLSPAGMAAYGQVEKEKEKPVKGTTAKPMRVEYVDPLMPGKKIAGPPETVIPQVAERAATKQLNDERNKKGSVVSMLKAKHPELSDKQIIELIKAAEIKKMVEDLKKTKQDISGGE